MTEHLNICGKIIFIGLIVVGILTIIIIARGNLNYFLKKLK